MKQLTKLSLILSIVISSTTALANMSSINIVDGILTGVEGKTLYTFDKDIVGSNTSACYDTCSNIWPPVIAGSTFPSNDYSSIMRTDGIKQLVYKGAPLYYFSKDLKAGDKNGDGIKNIWKIAKP